MSNNNHTPSTSNPKVTYTRVKNGYFYHIPFDQIERIEYSPMNGKRGETVTNASKRVMWNNRYPDIIINAELFNMTTYAPSSGVVSNGKNMYLPETYGISFINKKTPAFCYKNNLGAVDWLGAYPVLVRNGRLDFTSIPSGLGGNRARTAIGIKGNTFGVLVIPEQSGIKDATLKDVANAFLNEGYTYAINFDGGGSTAYQTNEVSYEQGRKVRGFVSIWYKDGNENLTGRKVNKIDKIDVNANANTNVSDDKEIGGLYKIKITASKLNVRKGAGVLNKVITTISKDEVYTVMEVKNGWGKLNIGGWINLKYSKKI